MKQTKKPPLGIIPAYLYHEDRIAQIKSAIKRYKKAGAQVPIIWTTELNMLKLISNKKYANF